MAKLFYHVRDGGDGSVSVDFHTSEKEAEKAEEEDIENAGYGWGEPSVSYVELRVVDGQIEFSSFEEVKGKYQTVWKRLK